MKKTLSTLLSKIGQFWSLFIDKKEYAFFKSVVEASCGKEKKALEIFCGSGRILCPLVKEGFKVDGIEQSIDLVNKLNKRLLEQKLRANIYQMNASDISIKYKYGCMFIAAGSFQLIIDREEAESLLSKMYLNLEKEGVISISLFLPYVGGDYESDKWKIASDFKDKESKHRYVRREKSTLDPVEQTIFGAVRTEIWLGRDLLEMEEKDLRIRWYGKYEFISLLKETGFKDIEVRRSYEKTGSYKQSLMIFIARK